MREISLRLARLQAVLPNCQVDLTSPLGEIREAVAELIPYKRELQHPFRIYLTIGGIPLVINHYLENRYERSRETIEPSVAEVFVRSVLGDLVQFQRQETVAREILKAVVEEYGSRYSFSRLSRRIERTHVTTIDYLEFMEEPFILFVHYAYDFNRKGLKSRGDKKVFFIDPFIYYSVRSYLAGRGVWEVITEVLQDEGLQGSLVEGVVLSHLLMHREVPYLREGRIFLWTYYDKSGREIDGVARTDGTYWGIEVKYQTSVDEWDFRLVVPIRDYILLSREDVGGKGDILIVPVDAFLALLPLSGETFRGDTEMMGNRRRYMPSLEEVRKKLLEREDLLQDVEAQGIFGSLPRGDFSERSDIDIFMMIREKDDQEGVDEEWYRRIKEVLEDFRRDVTVLSYTPEALREAPSWYTLRLASEAVLIYDRGKVGKILRSLVERAREVGLVERRCGRKTAWMMGRPLKGGERIEVKAADEE